MFTSTFESGSLSQLLQSVPQHLEESVVIIEAVINLDASDDTMDVSGQTIGDTIELSSDSSNTGGTMVSQETSSSSNSCIMCVFYFSLDNTMYSLISLPSHVTILPCFAQLC